MVSSGVFKTQLPCIASHEGAGTIVKLGVQVKGFNIGDRVMCGVPYHPCGACPDCLGPDGRSQYCVNLGGHCGVTRNGYFAEYAVADSRHSTLLPNEITFGSAAPLACAGRTIWRGVLQADLKPGEWLCIVGSGGGLGHLGIQSAKALGLNVIGIDARDGGLDLSKEAGADLVFDARHGKDAVVKQVQEVTGGLGAHSTITLSDARDAAALGCAVTMMHGTMIEIAQPDEVIIPFQELVFRDIKVHGSLLCSPQEANHMVETIAANGIKVERTSFGGLDKINNLMELVRGGKCKGKAVLIVDQQQIDAEKRLGAKY